MRDVTPQEIIEYFRTNTVDKPEYTPREISQVLQELGQKRDMTTFKELVDTWVDFVIRLRGEIDGWPEDRARKGALENIAILALVADLDLREPMTREELPTRMYDNETRYGPAMKAFSQYLGVKGRELVMQLWPDKYLKYLAPRFDPSLN